MKLKQIAKALIFAVILSAVNVSGFINGYAAATPVITYRNPDISGGDVGIITGYNFSGTTGVKLSRLEDGDCGAVPSFVLSPSPFKSYSLWSGDKYCVKGIEPTKEAELFQVCSEGINFLIPESYEKGVYAASVQVDSESSEVIYINQPIAKWYMSSIGAEECCPGGWLRIQGENLSLGEKTASVIFVNKSTGELTKMENVTVCSPYSLNVEIPSELPVGDYKFYVHNGYGGETAWSEPLEVTVKENLAWRTSDKVFNVKDYGAIPNDSKDDAEAITKAMTACNAAGGGTVLLPRGRYIAETTLDIPKYVTVKGEGSNLSMLICINDEMFDTKIHHPGFSATNNFGVENLTVVLEYGNNVINNNDWNAPDYTVGERYPEGNIYIKNNVFMSGSCSTDLTQEDLEKDYYDNFIENQRFGNRYAYSLSGCNIHIENNKHIGLGGGNAYFAKGTYIKGNTFEGSGNVVNGSLPIGTMDCIIEDNSGMVSMGTGTPNGGSLYQRGMHVDANKYWAGNSVAENYACDRELFTTDGGNFTFYLGSVASADGNKVKLADDLRVPYYEEDRTRLKDYGVVAFGEGRGQVRRFVDYDPKTKTVTLDSAFDYTPTTILIGDSHTGYILYDNEFKNGGVTACYGRQIDWIIDKNDFKFTEGIMALVTSTYNVNGQGGYYNFVNNNLNDSIATHWNGAFDNYQTVAETGYTSMGVKSTFAIPATVIRNNYMGDMGAMGYVQQRGGSTNVVFDKNTLNNAESGIIINCTGGNLEASLLYKNKFNNVKKPYDLTNISAGSGLNSRLMIIEGE